MGPPDTPLPSGYRYGPLKAEQEQQIAAFLRLRDWPFDRQKWLYLLRKGDLFGIYHGQDLAATGGLHLWPGAAAVVVMIVVHPEHTGKGLGEASTRYSMAQAGKAPCYLYATQEGMRLYERLGFVQQAESSVFSGRFGPSRPPAYQVQDGPLQGPPGSAILELDRAAYGYDRESFLTALLARSRACKIAYHQGRVMGYALCFEEESSLTLGPVVARDLKAAKDLTRAAAGAREVKVYATDLHPDFRRWLLTNRLQLQDRPPLMAPPEQPLPGQRRLLFAIAGHAYG